MFVRSVIRPFTRTSFPSLLSNTNRSSLFSSYQNLRKYRTSLVTHEIRPALTVFSDEENELRETIAKFAREVIKPKVREMDEKAEPDPEVLKHLFEQGIMGIEIPQELGGSGMDFISTCIIIEELAKVDPGIATIVDVHNTVVATVIKRCGTEEQKRKYLPQLAKETLGSFCLSEWGSGSDAFSMKSTATKKGNVWILNGTKAWITNAQQANIFIVFANADPSKGYRGITAFIVERGTPGLKIGKKENKLGIRSSTTNEVHLEDCPVPESNVLGEVGKGYKIAIESLNEGRIGIGAQMLGLAQGAFEATMPYLMQRKQFGQPIASFQGMQFQYATCFMEIEAARLMVYNAARLKEMGKPFIQESSMAKLFASQVAERVASKCIEMVGGVGFTKDFPQEKYFRDCKIGQIYEGTSNIQLQTIAKFLQERYK